MKFRETILRILLGIILIPGISSCSKTELFSWSGHDEHWGYKGETGAEHWGELNNEYQLCATGLSQSPVNISNAILNPGPPLEFNYKNTPLNIVNNGHTLQVNYEPGSYLKKGEESFQLLQFHFHTPSEHQVLKKPFDMEMHLVHKNKKNQLAVVAVMLEVSDANPDLKSLWEYLPAEINHPVNKSDISINALNILPDKREYLYYPGSLTTPPCSEGVQWYILNKAIPVSKKQVSQFKELIDFNSRPVQPIHERKIYKAQ